MLLKRVPFLHSGALFLRHHIVAGFLVGDMTVTLLAFVAQIQIDVKDALKGRNSVWRHLYSRHRFCYE